jgi:hypothetical protein
MTNFVEETGSVDERVVALLDVDELELENEVAKLKREVKYTTEDGKSDAYPGLIEAVQISAEVYVRKYLKTLELTGMLSSSYDVLDESGKVVDKFLINYAGETRFLRDAVKMLEGVIKIGEVKTPGELLNGLADYVRDNVLPLVPKHAALNKVVQRLYAAAGNHDAVDEVRANYR